ncbi:MAG: multidrug effflux MFS transporter [Alphaproteobacteria bacterium]|nr:multidrug effflux MFS transporter [Alphaproteobacteria bacterium]
MHRTQYVLLAVLLSLLTALDALTIDISLPVMPAIARGLTVDHAAVELSLSAYLIGIAIGQLIQGPASDRFGRKPILLAGLALYTLAAAAAAAAPSIGILIVMRVVQGFAASTGQILTRAIVRDKFARDEAARLLSFALIGLAFAPIIAPILGSTISHTLGWRSIFLVLAAYSATIGLLLWRHLDETIVERNAAALKPALIARNYWTLMTNRTFWSYSLCSIASFAGLFAFLTASPGIFINYLGLSAQSYSFVFAGIMVGHGFALIFGAHLVGRYGLDRLLLVGVSLAALSGLAAAAAGWLVAPTADWSRGQVVLSIAIPVAVYMAAFALIIPQAIAGAMAPFPDNAGAASSLMGFLQFTAAAGTATLISVVSDGSQTAMVTAIGGAGLLALGAWVILVRPIARPIIGRAPVR